jgi:phenylacetate-CoA ligase
LPVLEAIEGRLEDVVVGPDGREMVRFHSVFVNLSGLIEAQVIQEAIDRLRIKIVAAEGFGPEQEKSIRQRTVQRLGPVQVTIERVPTIQRNSRGKFRAVVSQLSDDEKRRARVLRG